MWLQLTMKIFIYHPQAERSRQKSNSFLQQTLACASAICLKAEAAFKSKVSAKMCLGFADSSSPGLASPSFPARRESASGKRAEGRQRKREEERTSSFFLATASGKFGCSTLDPRTASNFKHCIWTELDNRNTERSGSLLCLRGLSIFGEQTGEEEEIAGLEVNLVASPPRPRNPQRRRTERQLQGGVFSQPPFCCTLFSLQREIISLQRELLNFFTGNSLLIPSPMRTSALCAIQTAWAPIGSWYRPLLAPTYPDLFT